MGHGPKNFDHYLLRYTLFRMDPLPDYGADDYEGHGKLKDKVRACRASHSAWTRKKAAKACHQVCPQQSL